MVTPTSALASGPSVVNISACRSIAKARHARSPSESPSAFVDGRRSPMMSAWAGVSGRTSRCSPPSASRTSSSGNPRSRSLETTSARLAVPIMLRVRTSTTRSAPGSSFRRQSRAEASSTTLLLTLRLTPTLRDQFVSQADAFGHILAQDRASAFKCLRHGTYPQLAIVHIDENGVTRGDPELTAHCRRDHELTTVHDLNPLCFHLH